MYAYEKTGGATRNERQIEAFRKVLTDCELVDLGYTGQKYTWERQFPEHKYSRTARPGSGK